MKQVIYIIIDKTMHSHEALYIEKFYLSKEAAQEVIDDADRDDDLFILLLEQSD